MKTVIELAREAGFNPVNYMGSNLELFERFAELVRADERARMAEQPAVQQEPVGRLESDPYEGHVFVPRIDGDWSMLGKDLYNAPPAQRKPLDAGEISRIWKQHTSEDGPHHNPYDDDGLGFARAIEAAHNIKENT